MKNVARKRGAVDSTQKLAELIVDEIHDLRSEMNERFQAVDRRFEQVDRRFEQVDKRFDALEIEMRSGFQEVKKILDRHDTRISALEYKVFP